MSGMQQQMEAQHQQDTIDESKLRTAQGALDTFLASRPASTRSATFDVVLAARAAIAGELERITGRWN